MTFKLGQIGQITWTKWTKIWTKWTKWTKSRDIKSLSLKHLDKTLHSLIDNHNTYSFCQDLNGVIVLKFNNFHISIDSR